MVLVTVFWSLYAVDRELVYPRALDEIIPSWLNIIRHGLSFPTAFIDNYLVLHTYPSFFKAVWPTALFGLCYMGL